MKPTKEEIKKTLEVIDSLAYISAIHGMWTEPVPELIKVTTWLKQVKEGQ
jgi:hypothetical protein